MIIQGLGGRNKVDAPTATWEASKEFLDRAGDAGRRRLLAAHHPAVRPRVRRGRDQPALPRRAQLEPHAEPARDERRALLATRRPRPNCATRSRTTTAIPPRARPFRRRCGATSTSTSVDQAAQPEVGSRSIADIADETRRGAGRCRAGPRAGRGLRRTGCAGVPKAPSGQQPSREAQLDPRMIIGTSDGGAHLARDDGADWSSYFLRQLGTRPPGLVAGGGHPPDHRSPRRAGRHLRSRHADARRLGRHDDLRSGRRSARRTRSSPTTCRAGSAASKPLAAGCTATIVNGVPIVLGRRAHRRPARTGRPARWCRATVSPRFWSEFAARAHDSPDLPALFDEYGSTLSFGELRIRGERVAAGLSARASAKAAASRGSCRRGSRRSS